jgi:predicted nucleotide-binding protein
MGAIIDADTAESSFNYGREQLLKLLKTILGEINKSSKSNNSKSFNNNDTYSNKIFIVHGHNNEMKESVARTISNLKLEPIILHEQPSQGNTIIEKFETNSDVAFAIVLLSADDKGFNKKESPEKAKWRSRQNVIFELGYFIGKIGRKRVLALYEDVDNFELPSDYSGVMFIKYDNTSFWKLELVKELKAIGIQVSADDLLS